MPFLSLEDRTARELVPNVFARTYWGEKMLISHVTLEAGGVVPLHSHPHEQAGIVLEGEMTLTLGDETRTLGPGAMYIAPGGVEHKVVAGAQGCIALDVFSPVREEYQFDD